MPSVVFEATDITCSSVFPHSSVVSVCRGFPSFVLLTAQLWCREVLNTFIREPHQHAVQILLLSMTQYVSTDSFRLTSNTSHRYAALRATKTKLLLSLHGAGHCRSGTLKIPLANGRPPDARSPDARSPAHTDRASRQSVTRAEHRTQMKNEQRSALLLQPQRWAGHASVTDAAETR